MKCLDFRVMLLEIVTTSIFEGKYRFSTTDVE